MGEVVEAAVAMWLAKMPSACTDKVSSRDDQRQVCEGKGTGRPSLSTTKFSRPLHEVDMFHLNLAVKR